MVVPSMYSAVHIEAAGGARWVRRVVGQGDEASLNLQNNITNVLADFNANPH